VLDHSTIVQYQFL